MRPSRAKPDTKRLSATEALIYAMVASSAVDRKVTSEELARIDAVVRELPAFQDYDAGGMGDTVQSCGRLLGKPGGVEEVLALIKAGLPERLYETAFVLAAEVAASDLEHHASEADFLAMLAATLGLDALVSGALQRAVKARHETA